MRTAKVTLANRTVSPTRSCDHLSCFWLGKGGHLTTEHNSKGCGILMILIARAFFCGLWGATGSDTHQKSSRSFAIGERVGALGLAPTLVLRFGFRLFYRFLRSRLLLCLLLLRRPGVFMRRFLSTVSGFAVARLFSGFIVSGLMVARFVIPCLVVSGLL